MTTTCPVHGTAHERHLDQPRPTDRYAVRVFASWSDVESDAPAERHYYATRGEAISAAEDTSCPVVDVVQL